VGVFAAPRTYQAWIRFSNGSGIARPDSIGDGRGMAIKLMGVAESPSTTQDFVMINHPVFFVRNAADYVDLQTASNPIRFFFPSFNPFRFRLHEGMIALAIAGQKVRNALNIRYWSMTPYRLGNGACKFSARPAGVPSPSVATDVSDFLHANLARHLAKTGASFDFMVQLRSQPDAMPIEDPTIIWDEAAAPFVPVASITIPPQDFDSPEQHAFCENLSFTPGHCVGAHRPLGGINRVRQVVYEHISRLRHELNGVTRSEPIGLPL
jgi:catalase